MLFTKKICVIISVLLVLVTVAIQSFENSFVTFGVDEVPEISAVSDKISEKQFNRIFALNMRKNKYVSLASMTFTSNFISGNNSNMYPVLQKNGTYTEKLSAGKYSLTTGSSDAYVSRFFARFFPYASYEFTAKELNGESGFTIINDSLTVKILFGQNSGKIYAKYGTSVKESSLEFVEGTSFIVTFRAKYADIYIKQDGYANFLTTFTLTEFGDITYHDVYNKTSVAFTLAGNGTTITDVCQYIDCGITQADIKPIKYEDGTVIVENGKMFFTMTARQVDGDYLGVFSWIPGTNELDMTGAIFFDSGDGKIKNNIAPAIKYNRATEEWYMWIRSYVSAGTVLGYAAFKGDVRYGKHLVDITLMPEKTSSDQITDFVGVIGDEDPDFIYDKANDRWLLTMCRLISGSYRYFLFESKHPFKDYTFITRTTTGQETGGSIIPYNDKFYFACGNSSSVKSQYRIYELPNFSKYDLLNCDYIDGGYRGWGSIFTIESGTRTKLYWITFDRYKGGSGNWSYGNLYVYEAYSSKIYTPQEDTKLTKIIGDANNDGMCNIADLLRVKKHIADNSVEINIENSDFTEDGKIDENDYLQLHGSLLRKI